MTTETNAERLERARKILKDMAKFIENVSLIGKEDTEYLDWLLSIVEEQQEVIEHYKKRYENVGAIFSRQHLREVNGKLIEENARLREALEFYANPVTYQPIKAIVKGEEMKIYPIDGDEGYEARKALAGETK